MSEIATNEMASESEKPVVTTDDVKLPPFPDPTDNDFDEDISDEEKAHYRNKFPDLNNIVTVRLHCTACDRHLGCSATNESRMRPHPMLRTLICHTCHSFYNSGEFDKGEDGSELYCRWCGQGGQVYCCSNCIHVFCAKCIKRNLGLPKIKEIENTDDWKCFKCNPKCIWDLRAVCWALLRYCDLRNKLVIQTEDVVIKQKYAKLIGVDATECCKSKLRKSQKSELAKKKEKEADVAKKIISKMPPTIQVKKFASVNLDEFKPKLEKKAQKRPASPKNKAVLIKNPISIAPCPIITPISKKIRMTSPSLFSPIRFPAEKKINVTRVHRPRMLGNVNFNGFNSPGVYMNNINNMNNLNINNMSGINMNLVNDNINLSLDSLTQGLDFAAVQAMNNSNQSFENNDDVVCTPDFPMEPLCEVTEDNDDDVECITPGPVAAPKVNNPPPLVPVRSPALSNMPKGNVIQMTDSDVTVNALTGGLKFRVDPQTLSSNKMYRLPDGRIFAINANSSMPGGYSATIVSQNPDGTPKVTPRSETFAAKLSAVSHSSPKPKRGSRNTSAHRHKSSPKPRSKSKDPREANRTADLKVPVEWFRYNVIDAVDALEYSLSRLHKLKKETTSGYLRTRTVDEMKYLHRTLEQLLSTSSKRFGEIRETLNKEMKTYISHKHTKENSSEEEDDDDDVEILPNTENDDPIFIDENSDNEGQEVDLTGAVSSEHNDSTENRNDPMNQEHHNINNLNEDSNVSIDFGVPDASKRDDIGDAENAKEHLLGNQDENEKVHSDETPEISIDNKVSSDPNTNNLNGDNVKADTAKHTDDDKTEDDKTGDEESITTKDKGRDKRNDDNQNRDDDDANDSKEKDLMDKNSDGDKTKDQDAEMSEEMIETLLKDDNLDGNASMEISDLQEAEEILS